MAGWRGLVGWRAGWRWPDWLEGAWLDGADWMGGGLAWRGPGWRGMEGAGWMEGLAG